MKVMKTNNLYIKQTLYPQVLSDSSDHQFWSTSHLELLNLGEIKALKKEQSFPQQSFRLLFFCFVFIKVSTASNFDVLKFQAFEEFLKCTYYID